MRTAGRAAESTPFLASRMANRPKRQSLGAACALHAAVGRAECHPLAGDRFGPSCPQALKPGVNLDLSEDCLSLNVWTPIPLEQAASADPLPVMIFIYGGSIVDGSAIPYSTGAISLPRAMLWWLRSTTAWGRSASWQGLMA